VAFLDWIARCNLMCVFHVTSTALDAKERPLPEIGI
jgi:hypothetical protein